MFAKLKEKKYHCNFVIKFLILNKNNDRSAGNQNPQRKATKGKEKVIAERQKEY